MIHRLPGDDNATRAETVWFKKQTPFEQAEIRRQVEFKRTQWPGLPATASHRAGDHEYPHILPKGHEDKAFFPGFAAEVLDYMRDNEIEVHSEILNLKSSQACCLNLMFPLRRDLGLARRVLQQFNPAVAKVTGVEFEYTGQDEASLGTRAATEWLGEPTSGKRGQQRTSIDVAVFWIDHEGRPHTWFIEWKYTERNFGTCSAYEKNRARCDTIKVTESPAQDCYLVDGGSQHRRRHYWERMGDAGIDVDALAKAIGCPFSGPLYQLMRQTQLAAFVRQTGAGQSVEVAVVEFEGNTSLEAVPPRLTPLQSPEARSIVDIWNQALDGVPRFTTVRAGQLMSAYQATGGYDAQWRRYISARYGV